MARGFLVRREVKTGNFVERPYELRGSEVILLTNLGIRLPCGPSDNPCQLIEMHERKTWPTLKGPIEISEFESLSGTFIPSIARPEGMHDHSMLNPRKDEENEIGKSFRWEHHTIADDIERCFDVASPAIQNYQVFGTQFEKTIYFACVGIESLFNKILTDNGLSKSRTNMNDFVRLKPHLRLNEYSVSILHYPWLPQLKPFLNWQDQNPSESLGWFDAYNSLKHDKQSSIRKATMQNAIDAAAAYYALTFAVFGDCMFSGYIGERFFFQFAERPAWEIDERYFSPDSGDWLPRPLVL